MQVLPEEPLTGEAGVARLLGLDKDGEADATFKEFVVVRSFGVVQVYNLVSHGRRVYRTLVFSSDYRFGLHCLEPMGLGGPDRKPIKPVMRFCAGDC